MSERIFNIDGKKIFVAGHRGMVGSAIGRALSARNCDVVVADRSTLDLRDQAAVRSFFTMARPDAVVLAAAKVGGIVANESYPADFIYDNLMIETNVIDAAHRARVSKLLFLGSSCIYPKQALQPIREEALLSGPLEPTNEWYAIAKIAGLKLCEAYRRQHGDDFISAMPTNLYGINDNFDLEKSHVLPALIRKMHDAKVEGASSVVMWGTGAPRREFLNVDDLADACIFMLERYSAPEIINIGWGKDITIKELAHLIADVVGFTGGIVHDTSRPDGMPRKLLDTSRLKALGWQPKITLREGIESTYRWFKDAYEHDAVRLHV